MRTDNKLSKCVCARAIHRILTNKAGKDERLKFYDGDTGLNMLVKFGFCWRNNRARWHRRRWDIYGSWIFRMLRERVRRKNIRRFWKTLCLGKKKTKNCRTQNSICTGICTYRIRIERLACAAREYIITFRYSDDDQHVRNGSQNSREIQKNSGLLFHSFVSCVRPCPPLLPSSLNPSSHGHSNQFLFSSRSVSCLSLIHI